VCLCDFCVDPRETVRWRYPARDFRLPALDPGPIAGIGSRGDWAACEACHALIDTYQWTALASRSAASYAVKYETPAADILPMIRVLHALFALHCQGAPVPHVSDRPCTEDDPCGFWPECVHRPERA
jgi:hypothetical protein